MLLLLFIGLAVGGGQGPSLPPLCPRFADRRGFQRYGAR